MKTTKWAGLTLMAVTVLGLVGAFAALACGPAASAPQVLQPAGSGNATVNDALSSAGVSVLPQGSGEGSSEGGKPTPTATLTPTSTPICWEIPVYGGEGRMTTGCELPGPPETDFGVRMAIKEHKERSAKRARGEPVEPVTVDVTIFLGTSDAVDRLLEFLETEAGGLEMYVSRSSRSDGWLAGIVNIYRLDAGLIEPIFEIGGVLKMETIVLLNYGGSRLQQSASATPTLTAAQLTHADEWHRAGFTGAGVGVGVIDSSFQDFETRVLPMLGFAFTNPQLEYVLLEE